jgi:membrane protease YdiL (CAAX protease family)
MAAAFTVSLGSAATGIVESGTTAESTYGFTLPQSAVDYVVLVVLSLSIGFSEELAMRGYLIPRFEKLLGSTTSSVLVSTTLFASYHLYQGLEGTAGVFVIGLVFGIAFCWTRRLWPIVIAHAMADIWAMGAVG